MFLCTNTEFKDIKSSKIKLEVVGEHRINSHKAHTSETLRLWRRRPETSFKELSEKLHNMQDCFAHWSTKVEILQHFLSMNS